MNTQVKPGMWVVLAVLGCVVWLLVSLSGRPSGPVAPVAGLELVGEPAILTKQFGLREVVGRVRNTDTAPRSGGVEVTLFDTTGKVIGTAYGPIAALQPGEEATCNGAVGTTVPEAARVEARVGAQRRDPQR